jgi:hypothetical protein
MKKNVFFNALLLKCFLLFGLTTALMTNGYALEIGKELLGGNEKTTTVYFVKTDGNDSNDGLSWTTAFATVQHGINEAHSATGNAEVWVAHGTYYPTECLSDANGQQTADVFKSFIMYAGINVYGGFAGTETTNQIGVSGGRQLTASGNLWDFANVTILDGSQTPSYHVVWFGSNGFGPFDYSGIQVQIPNPLIEIAIMDGFTITGGFANMNIRFENTDNSKRNYVHCAGGGVALVGNGELQNCIVENNKAKYGGAGIAMFNGAKIDNCLVQDNEAVGVNFYNGLLDPPLFITFDYWRTDGAGIVSAGSDTNICVINNSVIHNNLGRANDNYPGTPSAQSNKTNNGGGVYLVYTEMNNSVVSSNNIVNNPHPYDGNSGASCGGGVYMYTYASLDNCEITDNGFLTSAQNGAGVFIADYVEHATDYNDLVVKNSFIHSNRAGGAIAIDAQYSTVESCVVANNEGSGIYGYGNCTRSRTVNCLVFNNQSYGWGHTTNANNQLNSIINSTVVNNGHGLYLGNSNNHVVSNCIVWGNNSNSTTINTNATVLYSAFSFSPPPGAGNSQLNTDNATGPKFESPTTTHGINVTGWNTASWKLEEFSPCIDYGEITCLPPSIITDIEGNPRILGCGIDIGAYESPFGAPEIELSLNSTSAFPLLNVYMCVDDLVVFTFENATSGDYPFTVSWTVNNNPGHPLSGTDVSVTAAGQVLFSQVLDAGQYEIAVTSIEDDNGCVSPVNEFIATIIVSPEFDVLQNGHVLSAIAENATYQWVDCDNSFAHISGETDSVFTATINGNYAVIVTQNTCVDTSACFNVNTLYTEMFENGNVLVYPNPSNGQFNVEIDEPARIVLFNSIGSQMFEGLYDAGVHSMNFSSMEAGVYLISIRKQNQIVNHRIIIQ